MRALGFVPGTGVTVSATGSSVGGTIDCTGCDAMWIVNTSTTLNVSVRMGTGAQTAVLTTDMPLAPLQGVLVGCNEAVTHVAAIGSAAGPTAVRFMPIRRGG